MFRSGRRHHGYGYGGRGGIGMLLLGLQLFELFNYFSRTNQFLPVTVGVLGLNILAFLRPGSNWPNLQEVCISVQGVWFSKEWKRVLFAPFFHANDFHLYYNMASFVWKAISLERHFGSGYFLYMIAVFSITTNLVYLGINMALAELLDKWSYVQSCAVGFSGVIFAVKVVTTHMQPGGMTLVMGLFPIPMRLACWAELILISVLFPNVSFVGHLSGILVGLAFVSGPLRAVMELPLSLLSDMGPAVGGGSSGRSYTYRAEATGYRPPQEEVAAADPSQERRRRSRTNPHQERSYTSYTYASGTTGRGRESPIVVEDSEEEELQEALRRSMEETHPQPPSHPQPPPDSHHHHEEHDKEMQMALERSLTDAQDHNPPTEPSVPPPPYNPNFPSPTTVNEGKNTSAGLYPDLTAEYASDRERLTSNETSISCSSQELTPSAPSSPEPSSLRRRAAGPFSAAYSPSSQLTHGELKSVEKERSQSSEFELSRERLRAARLQRFERSSQQRKPLDMVNRRSGSQDKK